MNILAIREEVRAAQLPNILYVLTIMQLMTAKDGGTAATLTKTHRLTPNRATK